jgi:hypothetical protein
MHHKAASNCAVVVLGFTPWTKNYRMPFVAAVSMEPRYIEILFQIQHLIHWYETI